MERSYKLGPMKSFSRNADYDIQWFMMNSFEFKSAQYKS